MLEWQAHMVIMGSKYSDTTGRFLLSVTISSALEYDKRVGTPTSPLVQGTDIASSSLTSCTVAMPYVLKTRSLLFK